ncbi:dihydrofolate reductase family protein [Kribbella sp. NPDC002412]
MRLERTGRGIAPIHQRQEPGDRHVSLRPANVRDDGLWEDPPAEADAPYLREYARIWQATEKIVYSTTLTDVSSKRTRIERSFDPDAVRKLKAESELDLGIDGPNLAAQAIRAGLVDEYQLYVGPAIVGGGKRFFPDGVWVDLDLLDLHRFTSGALYLRYAVKP